MKSEVNGCQLSIVIPVYNEEEIIVKNINKIIKYLKRKKYSWEILVVNDGSIDSTLSLIKKIKNKHLRLINFKLNIGKGRAVREGMLESRGENILFMDIDLSVPLTYIEKLLSLLKRNSDVVIGSRRVENSKILVRQTGLREFLGRGFTSMTRQILQVKVSDFTCGFKGFKKVVARKIFSNAKIDRWAFDAEILFLAKKFGFETKELPVEWKNRRESRVRLWPDLPKSLFDTLSIKLWDILGIYKK